MGTRYAVSGAGGCVLVLGPHRSGTSAVARVLNLLGVALGDDLLPPDRDNRHGFWEHRRVFELHERLFDRLGVAWHEAHPLPAGWRHDDDVEEIRSELSDLLAGDLAPADVWGVKDPRISRLVPLWLDVVGALGTEPRFLIVVRNPLEVVDSLQRRQGFAFEKCFLLYLREVVSALHDTRGHRRSFVSYDRLLDDWRSTVADVAEGLELCWPRSVEEAQAEIDSFLRPSERHHRHSLDDLRRHPAVPRWCAELYAALEEESRGGAADIAAATDRAYDALVTTGALFLPELEHLRDEVARVEQRAERARSDLATVQEHLTSILSTPLYRWTRLPRRLGRRLWRHLSRLR